jgi:phosphonate degradation associated HDIG domain protein
MKTINDIVEEVFSLYEQHGSEDYIGEPVSQLEHMSQAAELAIRERWDDEVVLAAFFHDIGHICVMSNSANNMSGFGVKSHERIGGDYLRSLGFPERIARLVESHVPAKRYLTFKYPDYYNRLSEASKKTLEFQGGKMTISEAEAFEKDPIFEPSIMLRRWDDLAKETAVPIVDLEDIKRRAARILQAACEQAG